jgi:hypothetical protein
MNSVIEQPLFSIQPITYPAQAAEIAKLADEYMPLTVSGIDDKEGLELVRAARLHVKGLRVDVEKRRKELKAESLQYGRLVDSAAKKLTELLTPIEQHLEHEEGIVEREKARLKKLEEERQQAIVAERIRQLQELGVIANPFHVTMMSESDFAILIADKVAEKLEHDKAAAAEAAERARVAAEQKVEADKLAAERAVLEQQRKEQAAAQAKIDAEHKRIADEAAAQQRADELKQAKAEAAEKARKAAIADQERKAAKEKAAAEAEAKRLAKIARSLPDREKLLSVADKVAEIDVPVCSIHAISVADDVGQLLVDCGDAIRELIDKMLPEK